MRWWRIGFTTGDICIMPRWRTQPLLCWHCCMYITCMIFQYGKLQLGKEQDLTQLFFLGHSSRRLQWPIVIPRCPASVVRRVCLSSVRPSVPYSVRQFYIFNFFSRTAWWILMTLGMDEVLKVHYKCCCFSARSAQGRIQGGTRIGHGDILLQRTSSSDQEDTGTNRRHSSVLEACGKKCCYFWFHSKVKFLTRF